MTAVSPTGASGADTVRARQVSRSFGGTTVVRDLDMTVPTGTIHGLIGPSGSGKTTTVRMLTGFLEPTSGQVEVFGTSPTEHDTATRQRIGYMPQLGVLYPELSIVDNLLFVASLYGVRQARERIGEMLELLDLGGTQRQRLDSASGGMQRRVALAGALLHEPDLLFLDEPTSGLDPRLRQAVWAHFQHLRDEGTTVVVTTQIVSEATMCDTVGLIADGAVVSEGTPVELRRRAEGGDVVDVRTGSYISRDAIEALQDHVITLSARRTGEKEVRLIVEDAEKAMPVIDRYMEQDLGLDSPLAERYVRPFDDVFVMLLEHADV